MLLRSALSHLQGEDESHDSTEYSSSRDQSLVSRIRGISFCRASLVRRAG